MKGLFLAAGMALCLCSCGSVCASGGNVTAETEDIASLSSENEDTSEHSTETSATSATEKITTEAKTVTTAAPVTTATSQTHTTTSSAKTSAASVSTSAETAETVTTAAVTAETVPVETEPETEPEPEPEEPAPETEPVPEPEYEPEEYYEPEEEYTPPEPQSPPEEEYSPEEQEYAWEPDPSEYAVQVAMLVNQLRQENGLYELELSETLFDIAQLRAEETATMFSHMRPDGRSCFSVYDDWGLSYWYVAENIAAGQTDPESVINTWLNSPGHKANMLSENVKFIGVGYVNYNGVNYWVQDFIDSDDL